MASDIHLHALEWNANKMKESPIMRIQTALFSLIYKLQITGILLSDNIEIFLNVFDLLECLAFPFHVKYRDVYTKNANAMYITKLFDITSTFFAYFTLMPFYNKISLAYYVTLSFLISSIFFTIVFIYIVTYFKLFNYISLKLIKFSLYLITNCLYLPMMLLFLCPFYLPHDISITSQHLFLVLGICLSIILFLLSYITKAILYDHKQKMTSLNDIYLLLMKTLLVLLYTFFDDQYLLSIMTFLCGLFMFYHTFFDTDNKKLKGKLAQMTMSLTFLWGSFVVFIVKVFNGMFDLNFNGGVLLFYGGLIVVIITCFFFDYNKTTLKILLLSIEKCSDGFEAALHILTVLQLISTKEKHNTRENDIFLEGYIKSYEDLCTTPNCPLKKYTFGDYSTRHVLTHHHLNTLIILLYQHIEILFKRALNKFPSCVRLRLYYVEFLYEVMHKRTHALSELYNIIRTGAIQTFEENYLIFKLSNELCMGDDAMSKYGNHESKVASFGCGTEYKQLKKEMVDASSLYMEFWNLLMEEGDDDNIRSSKVNKLNNLGTQITRKIEEIDMKFNKLIKQNTRNIEIYYCYSEFLGNILNKTDDAYKYKTEYEKMLFIKNSDSNQNYMNYFNNDLSELNEIIANMNKTDQFQYIIISANNENFGVIENISLNLCIVLGYTRDELIGKKIDIIIPELLQKEHNKMLHFLTNEFRRKIINTSFMGGGITMNELQQYKQNTVFAMDKAKYLIEFTMIPGITHSDMYGISFVARLMNKNIQNNIENYYCNVLTNSSFLIQSFTTSALHILGFNSHYVNSNIDMTKMIKQFFAEFLKGVVDLESLQKNTTTTLEKLKIKQEIANKYIKQSTPIKVTYKLYELALNEQGYVRSSRLNQNDTMGGSMFRMNKESSRTNTIDDNNKMSTVEGVHGKGKQVKLMSMSTMGNNGEENFLMEIKKVSVNNKVMGYMFRFEPLIHSSYLHVDVNASANNNLSLTYLNTVKDTAQSGNVTKKRTTGSSIGVARLKESVASETILTTANANYTKFIIDPLTMSYSTNMERRNEFKENIKELAFQKLQYLNPKTSHSSSSNEENESDEDYNESDEEDEYSSNVSGSAIKKERNESSSMSKSNSEESSGIEERNCPQSARMKSKRKTKFGTFIQHVPVNKTPPPNDTYYNVNLLNIKLLIYNFERNAIVESPIMQRYSKVDQIIKGYGDESDFHKDKNSYKSQNDLLNANELPLSLKQRRNSMNDIYSTSQQDIIQKQIEQKLQKKETHKSIIYMTLISVCFLILMLGYSILFFIILHFTYKSYRSCFILFSCTFFLIANQLNNIYNVRELTLLSYDKYTAYIQSYTKDRELALASMRQLYMDNYNYLNNITKIAKRSTRYNNITTQLYVVINNTDIDEYEIGSYNLTIIASVHQVNTAILNILHNGGDYRPLESNVFFYMHNAIKGGYEALGYNIIFSKENLNNNFKNTISMVSVVTFAVIPIFCVLCIVLCKMVDASLKKKGDFLAIFFEIGKNTIKASLERCEAFMQKLQSDNFLCEMNDEEDFQDAIKFQMKDANVTALNKQTKNRRSHRNDNASMNQNASNKNGFMFNKKQNHHNQEAHLIKFVLCMFFIVIYIMFFVGYLLFRISTKELKRYINSFEMECRTQNEYIKLIDNIMEFCFGSNLYIDISKYDNNISDYMLNFMTDVYEMDKIVPKDTKHLPKRFHKVYHELYSHDICNHVNNKESDFHSYFNFPEGKNCSQLLFGSSQFGMKILLSTYIIQMLDIKNSFYSHTQKGTNNNMKYNLTLIGTKKDPDNMDRTPSEEDLYNKYHPCIELNGVSITFNQQMYRFVIQPAFDKLRNVFFMEIVNHMHSTVVFFYIYISFIMLLILLSYCVGWIPFAKETNNIIYKTKNMLMIIPIDILRNMPSVYKVLKIYVNKQSGSSKSGMHSDK